MAISQSAPPPPTAPCPLCSALRAKERAAAARGNHSLATDCRVLIARHPHTAPGAAQ
ncbi:hypothetical protein GA0115251_11764 [Streptomyces sp. TverLS-915]|uniref:hypothetical protein n=1 Tax=Streptomyces sp. TverLS-915 TaxID=1839763 RepID=UPI00081EA17D|nr:hypothetical protein [Streptomyces sp. TverLS-915]SCD66637.1 hypothetical protein GA0115251_11764 [Streptomyces sp. TverLS-915]